MGRFGATNEERGPAEEAIWRSHSRNDPVSESGFSTELEKFIREHVQTLEEVEILLLLSSNKDQSWSPKSVYDVVKSNPASVDARLEELTARGILQEVGGPERQYKFAPASGEMWNIVEELRAAYKERPVKVVQAIYSKPPDSIQEFARAFRVRKDK